MYVRRSVDEDNRGWCGVNMADSIMGRWFTEEEQASHKTFFDTSKVTPDTIARIFLKC